MSSGPKLSEARFVALTTVCLAIAVAAAQADQCFNLRIVNAGQTITGTLAPNFPSCPSNLGFTVRSKGEGQLRVGFGGAYSYTAPSVWTSDDFDKVVLDVTCNIFTQLCDGGAQLYFKVNKNAQTAPTSPPAPPTTTTAAPTTTAPTTTHVTEAPPTTAPVATEVPPVSCTAPPVRTIQHGEITRVDVSPLVMGCSATRAALSVDMQHDLWVAAGTLLSFDSAAARADSIHTVLFDVLCGEFRACRNLAATVVVKGPVSLAPTPSSNAPPPPPPAVSQCAQVYIFEAPMSASVSLSLPAVEGADTCAAPAQPQYNLLTAAAGGGDVPQGKLTLRNDGSFDYEAPSTMVVDSFTFTMLCSDEPKCNGRATVVVSRAATAAPTPAPVPQCSGKYTLNLPVGNGDVGDSNVSAALPFDAAAEGWNCSADGADTIILRQPTLGSIAVTTAAPLQIIFTHRRGAGFGWDTARVRYSCETQACEADVDLLVAPTTIAPATTGTASPATLPPPQSPLPMPAGISCRGSCGTAAWATADDPELRGVFPPDDDLARFEYEIDADTGDLVVRMRGRIGNMAATFPTFEPLTIDGRLLPSGITRPSPFESAASAAGFNISCLDRQSPFGIGLEVWEWENATALRGAPGPSYNRGENYFQKFGGKHEQCDSFANSCKYAPLLTPRAAQPDDLVRWEVQVDECAVLWVGRIAIGAIDSLQRADGTPVFRRLSAHRVQLTLYAQTLKPVSWLFPSRGVESKTVTSTMDIITESLLDVTTTLVDVQEASEAPSPQPSMTFARDVQAFTFQGPSDRRDFGLNILLYPRGGLQVGDVVVTGVDLEAHAWTVPGRGRCAACTGVREACAANATMGGSFEDDCGSEGIVRLVPFSSWTSSCVNLTGGGGNASMPPSPPAHAPAAVSDMDKCDNGFNLTLRGFVPGAGTASAVGLPRGIIKLIVTFSNGQRHRVTVTQETYFAQLSADAEMQMCRSTFYWPVADPLGGSTPTTPYRTPADFYRLAAAEGEEQDAELEAEHQAVGAARGTEQQSQQGQPLLRAFENVPLVMADGTLALCNAPAEAVYFTTDWMFFNVSLLDSETESGTEAGPAARKNLSFVTVSAPAAAVDVGSFGGAEGSVQWITVLLAGEREGALPWASHASFLNVRRFATDRHATAFALAFTPGALLGPAAASVRTQMVLEVELTDRETGERTYLRRVFTISPHLSPAVRGERNDANEKIREAPRVGAEHFALMLAFVLAGAVVVGAGVAAYFDESARQIVKDQHAQMKQFVAAAVLPKADIFGVFSNNKNGEGGPKQQQQQQQQQQQREAGKAATTTTSPTSPSATAAAQGKARMPSSPSGGKLPELEQPRLADRDDGAR